MSKEAVRLFIEKAEQDNALQDTIRNWFDAKNETINLIDIGREHGFEFTQEEGIEVWNEIQNEEELSDFALEFISGGTSALCSNT